MVPVEIIPVCVSEREAMSNCIELSGNYEKTFSDKEIDISALKALVDSVKNLPDAPNKQPEYSAWWFLSHAEFRESGAFVSIAFGCGRSSFTWRDFRQTLSVLATFARRPIKIRFMLRDIDWDNNSRPGSCPVVLIPGGTVEGLG